MRKPRFKRDVYAALRTRLVRETELALALGFKFPDRNPRIPTVEVGKGVFSPDFAARYWRDVLGVDFDEIAGQYGLLTPQDDRYVPCSPLG